MDIYFYNTLTKKKEKFEPAIGNEVRMYSCGPTVYKDATIGNMRTNLFQDVLRRVLKYNGYTLKHVMNITDVGHLVSDADEGEDKMIKSAKEMHKTPLEIAEHYTKLFFKDLKNLNIDKVDGILLDLGVSSYQLDEKNRGFSYLGENDLDMRMDKSQSLTAKTVVNNYKEEELANIIYQYGEEKFSRNIAKNICLYRRKKKIETTKELVDIIEKSIPKSRQNDGHPAKRTFQAIRIEVNNEIKPLEKTVANCINVLNSRGRLCIITFHSLEDRAVKNAFNRAKGICTCPKDLPYCVCGAKELGKVITKKPIVASEDERLENSRSKSAKLRIFEKY